MFNSPARIIVRVKRPPVVSWSGHIDCTGSEVIYVYTTEKILTVGVKLYLDDKLKVIYTNSFFVYENVQYTINNGIITNTTPCNFYNI